MVPQKIINNMPGQTNLIIIIGRNYFSKDLLTRITS